MRTFHYTILNKISEMNVTGLPADVSIGSFNNNEIVHFKSPTPGFKNSSSSYEGSNRQILFSLMTEDRSLERLTYLSPVCLLMK